MTRKIAKRIQDQQDHGRQKYGKGLKDYAHDDGHGLRDWENFIANHLTEAAQETDLDWCERMVKIAGLAVSAIESYERKAKEAANA